MGNQQQIPHPDQDEMIAYVEGTLSPEVMDEFSSRWAGDPRLLALLGKMREDRAELRLLAIADAPQPVAGLIEDVLGVVERAMLLQDDPVAPQVKLLERRAGVGQAWMRYALAAGFIMLLLGAAWLLFTNVWYRPSGLEFAIDDDDEPTQAEVSGRDRLASSTGRRNQGTPTPAAHNAQPNGVGAGTATADTRADDATAAAADPDKEPSTGDHFAANRPRRGEEEDGAITRVVNGGLARDIGLAVRINSGNPNLTLSNLRADLADLDHNEIANTALLANVRWREDLDAEPVIGDRLREPDVQSSSPAPAAGDEWDRAPRDGKYRSAGRRESKRDAIIPAPSDGLLEFVPLEVQMAYFASGYRYTLVGTPSQIRDLLRSINRTKWQQAHLAAQEGSLTFDDFIAPAKPRGKEWGRIVLWWLDDPATNLALARRTVLAFGPEPIIRVPLEIVRSTSLERIFQDNQ